ncbi:MAG TPA: metal-dependent hydrolase [Kofleriaceae bacterium]|nr:metal-dependent hydrolase [Kofleriaceae bacterium]
MSIPVPRELDVDLTQVPRHWLAGNAAATAISNGINMLFPHGERFFVRSVKYYLDQIEEPVLRDQVKAFFKQEGHHAKAHDDFNAVLRTQGFEIDAFLERYRRITAWVEARVPAKLNLAGTAAAEHYTAILADGAFTKGVLDTLHPVMQQLLAWHAAEEIEHKSVAFDVLHEIDPSYALRVAGLAYATVMLGMFWAWATTMLLRQEKLGFFGTLRELRKMRQGDPIIQRVFIAGIRQYIRRDFHPRNNANEGLAARWFAERGLPFPEAA